MTQGTISCCIECEGDYLSKAQYALTTLLRPIRLQPDWVTRENLGYPGIFYGPIGGRVPDGVFQIPLAPSTVAYFERRAALDRYPRSLDSEGLLRLFPFVGSVDDGAAGNRLSWDPIASAFYLLSGWDEWIVARRDVHGRFPYAESVISRFGLAWNPMVDRYRRLIRTSLEALGLTPKRRLWNGRGSAACITHDVDYHRKWRPGIILDETIDKIVRGPDRLRGAGRLAGALASSAVNGDPFRLSLNRMLDVETVSGFGATWFFKAGAHGRYDVDYALERGWVKKIIDRLEDGGFEIGLHSSYFAADHDRYLDDEQRRLQGILSGSLHSVRSHYLRWFTGRTGAAYSEAGFTVDSSLGFAEQEGFRNGTSVPFRIFDVARNEPLGLWEMPVAVMDTTLYGYRNLPLEEGIDVTHRLLGVTKELGGVLVLLWHNIMLDKLGDPRIAPHFRAVTERLDPGDVYVASLRDALAMWLDQTSPTTPGDE